MKEKQLKILIATHKPFSKPEGNFFLPVHVGKLGKEEDYGYQGDDTGDHISDKNANFCELTALYWAWKNLDYDVLGLCHYRRYFDLENKKDSVNDIRFIDENELEAYSFSKDKIVEYLKKYDVILPKAKVYETTLEKDYGYCHSIIDFRILTQTIEEIQPEYAKSWNKISFFSNKLMHYNMFIGPKELVNKYCSWLFSILFEVEKNIKSSPYKYDQRVFGFMAERLMQLYFTHHSFKSKHLPVLYIKDKNFDFKTPSKLTTLLANGYKNFLFFLSVFPRKIKQKW